jgi:hypothetical protein
MRYKLMLSFCLCVLQFFAKAQQDSTDLLSLLNENEAPEKTFVTNAFKSSRIINGHSVEFIGKGVLDVRILHRFGLVNNGASDLFGLDQATMRFGFDYGVTDRLTAGIGRSTYLKEFDAFAKYRLLWQSTGPKSYPVSVVVVGGITCNTLPFADPTRQNYFSSRLGYYGQVLIGRKFSDVFSLQLAPTIVHKNLVQLASDKNDIFALGFGGRIKLTRRTAFVWDYHHVFGGLPDNSYQNPLSVGFDIETGGHVFQLHFSNSTGMNERSFITETTNKWSKGEFRFGFNLSRVFTVVKKKTAE